MLNTLNGPIEQNPRVVVIILIANVDSMTHTVAA